MNRFRSTCIEILIITAMMIGQSSARPQSDAQLKVMKKVLYDKCSVNNPITEKMKSDVLSGILPEDRDFKCFMKCGFEELSLANDGVIDKDIMLSLLDDTWTDLVTTVIKVCLPTKDDQSDGCELIFNFVKCGVNIDKRVMKLFTL